MPDQGLPRPPVSPATGSWLGVPPTPGKTRLARLRRSSASLAGVLGMRRPEGPLPQGEPSHVMPGGPNPGRGNGRPRGVPRVRADRSTPQGRTCGRVIKGLLTTKTFRPAQTTLAVEVNPLDAVTAAREAKVPAITPGGEIQAAVVS